MLSLVVCASNKCQLHAHVLSVRATLVILAIYKILNLSSVYVCTYVCECVSPSGRKQCRDYGSISNGERILNGTTEGSVVIFRCHDDFDLLGSRQLVCGSDGLWSASWPDCLKCELATIYLVSISCYSNTDV